MNPTDTSSLVRWRLILGRFSQQHLRPGMSPEAQRMERSLDFLYDREYQSRGHREQPGGTKGPKPPKGPGTLDPSQIQVLEWVRELPDLFPADTVEILEKHALERYGMTELLTTPEALDRLEPNPDLLRMLLQLKGHIPSELLHKVRSIIRKVVDELKEKMNRDIRTAFSGRINRYRYSPLAISQNFDWRRTLRDNLKNWQPDRKQLLLAHPRFFSRQRRLLPWHVVLCVDQSGSMVDSVIHTAVLAGILAGLPSLKLSLVLFDTSVVDLSDRVDDPVELLMTVQLGGGTDIGQALRYCEGLVHTPSRTLIALISDFCEGAPPQVLFGTVKRLKESGVKLMGLASLDDRSQPAYDHHTAAALVDLGMEVTASTPQQFAQWMAKTIS
ncbi:MAG: VWA domain-containing protein [Verrucomicrobia bacterium]|nr:VWA domain-containing protein [Verrucomicrobiota bacterium]MCH8513239.1 VWA domain-containing protein [Kiritimatiellia bacterium]